MLPLPYSLQVQDSAQGNLSLHDFHFKSLSLLILFSDSPQRVGCSIPCGAIIKGLIQQVTLDPFCCVAENSMHTQDAFFKPEPMC